MSEPQNIPTAPAQPVLEMRAVTVSAMRDASFVVVDHVDWTVAAGDFWVVGGPQHSGKTDLMFVAAGVLPPAAGSCKLFGLETRSFSEAELPKRLRVGFVAEGGQLFNRMTVAENVALPLRYHKNLSFADAAPGVKALLEADGTVAAGRRDARPRAGELAAPRRAGARVDHETGPAAARQSAERPGPPASVMVDPLSGSTRART